MTHLAVVRDVPVVDESDFVAESLGGAGDEVDGTDDVGRLLGDRAEKESEREADERKDTVAELHGCGEEASMVLG